jgi:alpha-glucosidase
MSHRQSVALLLFAALACGGPSTPETRPAPGPADADADVPADGAAEDGWWKEAVFYEIYPRSFLDTDGDGIGDLDGITSKLDYLQSLGVTALWITPFFPSPQVDFGYDVSDFEGVDPQFGSLEDFDRLLAEAHRRDIQVVIDLVLNHTSDRHPYFVSSRSSRSSALRDWYVWRDPVNGGPPNNWASIFEPSAWTLDEKTGQYYYHAFYAEQPDLNWRNPEVETALMDSVKFWLDRGVDGFRLDAIAHLYEDPGLRDNPVTGELRPGGGGERVQDHLHTMFQPECYPLLQRLRAVARSYPGDRLLIGEAYTGTATELLPYYGAGDQVQLPFNFLLMQVERLDAGRFRSKVEETEWALRGRWTNYVLGNHDQPRLVDRLGGGADREAVAKVLGLMLATLRGTPFLYYGDEIGMVTTDPRSLDEVRDPVGRRYWPENKGRDGVRTPMQWDGSVNAGFTTGTPWLPVPESAASRNVEAQGADPASVLSFYRRAFALRRASAALRRGDYASVGKDPDVFAYRREADGERLLVALNMSGKERRVPVAGGEVVLSTAGSSGAVAGELRLGPMEGVVVRLP